MADPDRLSERTRKTYRYLRVAVVGMAVLLGVSVGLEIALGTDEGILDSISAYYYTPVRGVFVGALLAVGLGLVAIKGREGPEDVMLNLAGMLAPLVALVPTPISTAVGSFEVDRRTVPSGLVPAVENNVTALLVLGVAGLVFAWATAAKDGPTGKAHRSGLVTGGVLLLGLMVWFGLFRQSFLEYGHYAAAVPMFGLIVGVAVVNARLARDAVTTRFAAATYRKAYGAIAVGMGVTIGIAVVFFVLDTTGHRPFAAWLFWVEVILLALFAAFWAFQTAENWREGVSDGSPWTAAGEPVRSEP
jgi:hypothetical protein